MAFELPDCAQAHVMASEHLLIAVHLGPVIIAMMAYLPVP